MIRRLVDKLTLKNLGFADQITNVLTNEFDFDVDYVYKENEVELLIYSKRGGEKNDTRRTQQTDSRNS